MNGKNLSYIGLTLCASLGDWVAKGQSNKGGNVYLVSSFCCGTSWNRLVLALDLEMDGKITVFRQISKHLKHRAT